MDAFQIHRKSPMQATKFSTISELKEAVASARDEAEREARQTTPKGFIKSRGAWFIAVGDGEPFIADGQRKFTGTKSEVEALVAECQARDDVRSIHIEGGFNFATCLADFREGGHDAWVSEWSVKVWERAAA